MHVLQDISVGKAVSERWKHIRDAFRTFTEEKSGDNRTKKYIYFDQLQFPMKIFEKDDTASSICDYGENDESGDEEHHKQCALI
ncbi:hypothetical protein NQ314_003677 [Rhamnusium bicolor]|uniref:MADF domain-containing protein n=1 Tax=Rhamnusium bicolor TaxID=1586634 RepID=A0AAV8ZNC8_9CUCU|nr:hypothetical protein NQ314_003677 [Rhamnusium bicolor]